MFINPYGGQWPYGVQKPSLSSVKANKSSGITKLYKSMPRKVFSPKNLR